MVTMWTCFFFMYGSQGVISYLPALPLRAFSFLHKFEYRSTKFETNSKFECPNVPNMQVEPAFLGKRVCETFWSFEFLSFSIVSDFGFRISNLTFWTYEKNFLPEKTRISQLTDYASSETALGRGGPYGAVNLAPLESTDTGCLILDTGCMVLDFWFRFIQYPATSIQHL